ncbi:MAG: hypothetical protein JWL60_2150 [Gemmatimonadetes bacterium]|jgi:hypothetical protein|nr:hypothetical protein [Gemmatimonadota bacterium]
MASREFTDPAGVQWTVWKVVPGEMSTTFRRVSGITEERRTPWLVFQASTGEKRRLQAVPDGWETCDEPTLVSWVMRAVRVPPAPARRTKER